MEASGYIIWSSPPRRDLLVLLKSLACLLFVGLVKEEEGIQEESKEETGGLSILKSEAE